MTRAEQIRMAEAYGDGPMTRAIVAVLQCPHRGDALPHTIQAEALGCGCEGGEWTECRAGRGPATRTHAVNTTECVECRVRELGLA